MALVLIGLKEWAWVVVFARTCGGGCPSGEAECSPKKLGHKKSAPQGRAFQFVEIRLEVELVFEVYKFQVVHGFLAQ